MGLQQSIGNLTDVSLILTKHMLQNNEGNGSNVVFSPLSIQLILSLIAAGSKGETLDELLTFLKAKSIEELNSVSSYLINVVLAAGLSSGGPHLSLANGVWIDKSLSFKSSFKNVMDHVYMAASEVVDFQNKPIESTYLLNSWVEKETNGLIKDICPLGSVDVLTRLVYANAIYFKGAWCRRYQFYPPHTKHYDFYLLDGSSVQVPFMTLSDVHFIRAFDDFKVVGLCYKKDYGKEHQFSMYFLLPNAKDGLPTLVEKLGSESGFLNRHLTRASEKVKKFLITKFKISFGFEASEALKGLGLASPFLPGQFTEMVKGSLDSKIMYATNIFHKSFIEVNEEGTKASAAFGIAVGGGCTPIKDIDFVADHPFMFFVREDTTGVVLFSGHVLNPLSA
ncbi:Serpin-ZX [Heracleum sosnowskyi]|uniref:Serpin-ZX n=1 Tax=Heracleum sosnowskyi TaxID=360622 RepID=A0AAD8GWD3_9APIA|nr:Serpin-ZX [Heracleum sosnowskyi]